MVKCRYLTVPIYNVKYNLIISEDYKKVNNHISKYSGYEYNGLKEFMNGSLITHTEKGIEFNIIFWVKNPLNNLGVMAHEVLHLVQFIMKDKGMVLSDDSEEAYAYLTGYLFDQIHTEYIKHYNR